MANASAHSQGHTATHLQSWPPPGGYPAPAIVEVTRGRRGKTRPGPAKPPRGRTSGRTPAPIPPHPALASGGWYRSVRREVLGPGRYPLRSPVDKSVGAAAVL